MIFIEIKNGVFLTQNITKRDENRYANTFKNKDGLSCSKKFFPFHFCKFFQN